MVNQCLRANKMQFRAGGSLFQKNTYSLNRILVFTNPSCCLRTGFFSVIFFQDSNLFFYFVSYVICTNVNTPVNLDAIYSKSFIY